MPTGSAPAGSVKATPDEGVPGVLTEIVPSKEFEATRVPRNTILVKSIPSRELACHIAVITTLETSTV